jgi:hypothetical protein
LDAYIAAARRGARVRIVLNGGDFDESGFQNTNGATVAYVRQIANTERLDLQAAIGDPTHYGTHNKMALVWLDGEGGYAHVGSINGSESSSKVNREVAIQVHSDEVYAYLKAIFDRDWYWSNPWYLLPVMRQYAPPAEHLLISEVMYRGNCEWVEIYNPLARPASLTGYGLGDAQTPGRYEGMYRFPTWVMGPGETVVVVGSAWRCPNVTPEYEIFGDDPYVPNLAKDPFWGSGQFGLSDTGDEVLLLSPSDRVVDLVVYGSGGYPGDPSVIPHPGVEWGNTLERIPANVDTGDCSHDFSAGWSPGWVRE